MASSSAQSFATVRSASSSMTATPAATRRQYSSDVFRPGTRLPLDPFAADLDYHEPWFLNPGDVRAATSSSSAARRDVILTLGTPTAADLAPILSSAMYSTSLLIVASAAPPQLSQLDRTPMAVRVLRLDGAPNDTSALRLVSALEWAERVARAWRDSLHIPGGIYELTEEGDDGAQLGQQIPTRPAGPFRFASRSSSRSPSPLSSQENLSAPQMQRRLSKASSKRASTLNTSSLAGLLAGSGSSRTFDAIFNFLPRGAPEKALLKHAILVTTLGRPFLAPTDLAPAPRKKKPGTGPRGRILASDSRRSSFLSLASLKSRPTGGRATSFYSTDSLPMPLLPPELAEDLGSGRAHIVHVLPPSKDAYTPALISGVEAFLLQFSYPAPSKLDPSSAPPVDDDGKAVGLLVAPGTLNASMPLKAANSVREEQYTPMRRTPSSSGHPSSVSLAELVLSGMLDYRSGGKNPLRAWLGSHHDVKIVDDRPPPSRTGDKSADPDVNMKGKDKEWEGRSGTGWTPPPTPPPVPPAYHQQQQMQRPPRAPAPAHLSASHSATLPTRRTSSRNQSQLRVLSSTPDEDEPVPGPGPVPPRPERALSIPGPPLPPKDPRRTRAPSTSADTKGEWRPGMSPPASSRSSALHSQRTLSQSSRLPPPQPQSHPQRSAPQPQRAPSSSRAGPLGLLTPPDSSESGEDRDLSAEITPSTSEGDRSLVDDDAAGKRTRKMSGWKFWKRSVPLAVS